MKKLMFLLVFCTLSISGAWAQKTFKGKVIGPDGLGLPGVNVVEKANPVNGAATDIDGNWTLTVPNENTILELTAIGMKPIEIAAKDALNLKMESDSQILDEVVVTASGMSKEKRAIGYSATSLKADEITASKTSNPMNALQGKVAGVDISSAPGPGATQNVIIRGASSFGNNQPLYIVDGVPITNGQNRSGDNLNSQVDFGSGINALNPDDIANLTVLKGAAATALYGSRAANGVVMITTKSGKDSNGKVQITYSGSYAISRVGFLPELQKQFGQGWSGDRALDENGNWGAAYDGKERVWGRVIDNSQKIKPYNFLENRVRDFYELGSDIKNSLSLSGGNEKTQYFVSLSQNSIDGVIPTDNDSYNRYTISTRGSHTDGKLTIATSVNFSTEKNRSVPSGQGTSMHRSLYEIANDISIVDLKDYNDKFNNLDNYFTPYGVNPYFILNNNGAEQVKNKFFGRFEIKYDFLENLSLKYLFGGDFETAESHAHSGIIAFTKDAPNAGSSATNPGSYKERRTDRTQLNHDLQALYSAKLSNDLDLSAIAGLNVNERKYSFLSGSITSIDIPGFYNLSNSLTPSVSDQRITKRRLMGLYGSVDLSYKGYAYLNLTARNDWSSTLPSGKNSYFYPGATLSFVLSDYIRTLNKEINPISFAKLRIAYGMTGNDADMYNVYDRYVPAFSNHPGFPKIDDLKFPLGGVNSYAASNKLGNPELEPELTKEFEVGLEMKFFNNRVGFDISYYDRITEGLIQNIPIDPSTGYTLQTTNLGDISNKGIELMVNLVPLRIGDFEWRMNLNYSKNDNKVEKLNVKEVFVGGFGSGGIYAVEGMPIGQFKFSKSKKVLVNGEKRTLVDGKGIPQSTTNNEFLGKDINEDFRLGFTNTFTWKGFELFSTFDYRSGGYIYSNTKDYMHWTGSSPETVLNDRNPFIIPNSVKNIGNSNHPIYVENDIPVDIKALHTFYGDGGFEGESSSIIDRSYLKLRNIGLSYKLPKKFCKKIKLNSLKLSFNAGNILLWTPKENPYIDPETTTFGNDVSAKFGEFGANPSNEVYTFGLTITL